jgi:hypothetical protein
MSNQIQQEINQRTAQLAQLERSDEENKLKGEASMMFGYYGQDSYRDQINASNPEIKRLRDYINSLNGVKNMWGNDQQKLAAFQQLRVAYENPNSSGYGWGGRRRYKKKSLKRKSRKIGKTKKRNTRTRK